ncbi:hypothetical protein VOI54_16770 [Tamlana sp. 2201CG12-4]|uniref:hypothetical protein n=1 Tax=Tamlana sp. 2201CG12-4 TaxID=3112582 RepID=UPI002DB616C5|nr:hypothetical protein [Tamlana sp. 2201CG12-4]MEC3908683.1 hypothetical protein [Tamlana sp. 2201CG12-4]
MSRISIIMILLFGCNVITAQSVTDSISSNSNLSYSAQDGLKIDLNDTELRFNGFIQPYASTTKEIEERAFNRMSLKRARLNFSGRSLKEKLSIHVNLDFVNDSILLDAYFGVHFGKFNIYAGQKHNKVNNLEMNLDERNITYLNRSLLSSAFSRSGREFGVFIEPEFSINQWYIQPVLSVTSGNGRNNFERTNDTLFGGLKYAARINVFPFGKFSEKEHRTIHDIHRESTPKLAIGASVSRNFQASDAVGEQIGDITFYDLNRSLKNANLDQLYLDVLFKWRGLSFLTEYASTRAHANVQLTNEDRELISPENIFNYYALGEAINLQLGYFFKNNISVDIRSTFVQPEFKEATSILQEQHKSSLAVSRFSKNKQFKIQFEGAYFNRKDLVENETIDGYQLILMTQLNF